MTTTRHPAYRMSYTPAYRFRVVDGSGTAYFYRDPVEADFAAYELLQTGFLADYSHYTGLSDRARAGRFEERYLIDLAL
jgi:hypothetical protein